MKTATPTLLRRKFLPLNPLLGSVTYNPQAPESIITKFPSLQEGDAKLISPLKNREGPFRYAQKFLEFFLRTKDPRRKNQKVALT